MEWLLQPETFRELANHCTRAGAEHRHRRAIPCDVAASLERGARDFARLAQRARDIDADVVALQEVDGPNAARLVFTTGYEFCFSGSIAVQNTGFAIRRGVPFRCGPDLHTLSLGDSLRRGAVLILYPDSPRELWLLDVHLKSGCARGPLDNTGNQACAQLTRQVPALEAWIDAQARAGHRFAVLGDFNRDLRAERGAARTPEGAQRNVWAEIDDGEPPGAALTNTAGAAPYAGCTPQETHDGFIDYIVTGAALTPAIVAGSFHQWRWNARESWRYRLSDHCPIAVQLRL